MESVELTPAVRPSMKERQWKLREDAILEAASVLLKTRGFAAMTLEDVTEAIGISRPTLYQHFKSKEDLAAHVAIRSLREIVALLDGLDVTQSPEQRLREFFAASLKWRFDDCQVAMYDMARIKMFAAGEQPELRQVEYEFLEKLAKLIAEGQRCGEVWNGIEARTFVTVLAGYLKNIELDEQFSAGILCQRDVENTLNALLFDRATSPG